MEKACARSVPPERGRAWSSFETAGSALRKAAPDLVVSKRQLRRVDALCQVRKNRDEGQPALGFHSRPFVLCGLPVKRPEPNNLLYERRNGSFVLQITGHPSYGLPWGQDRLVLIYLATLAVRQQSRTIRFRSGAEMLDAFALHKGGREYRRLVSAFERIFGATIFFGTDKNSTTAKVVQRTRLSFVSEAQIWCTPASAQAPEHCENIIVLSEEFYSELSLHPIPADLEAVRALSDSPAALDLFLWLTYRCFVAKGTEQIPLFGPFGLEAQIGSGSYTRPRRFREKLAEWLNTVHLLWPRCPARIDRTGQYLLLEHSAAIASKTGSGPELQWKKSRP